MCCGVVGEGRPTPQTEPCLRTPIQRYNPLPHGCSEVSRGCVPHSSSNNVTTRISFLAGASPHLPWFCALARFPGGWEKASVSHPGGTKNLGCFLLTQARPTKVSQRKWRRAAEGGQQPYRDGEADALLRERAGLAGGFPSHFFTHQIKRVTAAEHSPLASEASWRGRHTADFLVLSLPV